ASRWSSRRRSTCRRRRRKWWCARTAAWPTCPATPATRSPRSISRKARSRGSSRPARSRTGWPGPRPAPSPRPHGPRAEARHPPPARRGRVARARRRLAVGPRDRGQARRGGERALDPRGRAPDGGRPRQRPLLVRSLPARVARGSASGGRAAGDPGGARRERGGAMRRRELMKGAALAALPLGRPGSAPAAEASPDSWRGFRAGVASYTLRKLPLDKAIAAIQRVGLHYVSIKDFPLPLTSTAEERKAVARRFKDGGITPLSCGNITMENDNANVRRAFEYARDAGLPTIVCSPTPHSSPTLAAGVRESDTRPPIHTHGPEDKPSPPPSEVWRAAERYAPGVGLCTAVGHPPRPGANPAEAIRRCRERL